MRVPLTGSNVSPWSTNRAAPRGVERDVVRGRVLDDHVELPLGREHEQRVHLDRHATLRADLVAERLDAVGHRHAVAQQVLDAVRPGGGPDQRDGAVEDPDEVDRVVVRWLELEQDRCGQTDRCERDPPGRHGADELHVADVGRRPDVPVELAVLDVEPSDPRTEIGADHGLLQRLDAVIGRLAVGVDELDDGLARGGGLEGRTGRQLRGRDRRRRADGLLGARGEREHRQPRDGGTSTHRGADDTAGRVL